MKKSITIIALVVSFSYMSAQEDVIKFLGIPVDGYKPEMIQKLKAKGFQYDATLDKLTGEFNGRDVNIHVVTNNNKVCRIALADANYMSEGDIKIRFNTLCKQFENNSRYLKADLSDNYIISVDEDISYEMALSNKRYQAAYYQVNQPLDSVSMNKQFEEYIAGMGGTEEIAKMSTDQQANVLASLFKMMSDKYTKNSVWFMIDQSYGRYGILMFYDNVRNQANGEDL